jgi:hypothetical protein
MALVPVVSTSMMARLRSSIGSETLCAAKEHSKYGGLWARGAAKAENLRFFDDIHHTKKQLSPPRFLPITYIT